MIRSASFCGVEIELGLEIVDMPHLPRGEKKFKARTAGF
jgi:hypothetical protein